MPYSNGTTAASGMSLDGRALRHLSARQRACMAASILDGPGPFQFTASQLAVVLRVSAAYIAAARAMSPEKRAAILDGRDDTSFASLLNLPKAPLALPAPATAAVTDAALAEIVRTAGNDRVLEVAAFVEVGSRYHHQ